MCSGLHFYGIGDFVHQGDDIETFLVEDQHARFEFRYLFQVLHDIDQPVYAFFGAFQVFAVDVFVLQSAVEQGQDVALYRKNRGFDFVRHIAEELFAVSFVLFEPGDFLCIFFGPKVQFVLDLFDQIACRRQLVRFDIFGEQHLIDRFDPVTHEQVETETGREIHDREHASRDNQDARQPEVEQCAAPDTQCRSHCCDSEGRSRSCPDF